MRDGSCFELLALNGDIQGQVYLVEAGLIIGRSTTCDIFVADRRMSRRHAYVAVEGNDLITYLESVGTRFGAHLNAHTNTDETVYKLEVPTDDPEVLDTAFLVFDDWADGITFDPEEIEKERGVVLERFENLQPKYNEARGCYTLNFFGRVQKASARNFQLVRSLEDGEEGAQDDEFCLSHGKCAANNFNLDFRAPFSQMVALAISLSAIGKKRVVG